MNQVNKHWVSRRCFNETDVKHFKSGALQTITNIVEKKYNLYRNLKKQIYSIFSFWAG